MDLLDRLLDHDSWTTRQLLDGCSRLSDEQLDRKFDIGHRSVRATLLHIIFNMEVWSALMAGEAMSGAAAPDNRVSVPEFKTRLDVAAERLARVAKGVSARSAWDECWLDVLDEPPTRKSYGGAIAHAITHSMHHRSQLLYMLRQLGCEDLPEGDVLSWEHRRKPA